MYVCASRKGGVGGSPPQKEEGPKLAAVASPSYGERRYCIVPYHTIPMVPSILNGETATTRHFVVLRRVWF